MKKKRILVAPLDWGLGHATRCVPIIQALQHANAEVLLASGGRPLAFLRQEFPELPSFELPPYDVRYPSDNIYLSLGSQTPHILHTIWRENRAIRDLVRKESIDGIISDQRYGCSCKGIPSVFITHQLHPRADIAAVQYLIRNMHYAFIGNFDQCWVPDWPQADQSLAGDLDHPPSPIKQVTYIGPLSRFKPVDAPLKYDALMLISGPEPQRTRLETLLLAQAWDLPGRYLFVLGKTEEPFTIKKEGTMEIVPSLPTPELAQAIAASRLIVCRSGYSSIMDLAVFGKPALLIPTPGQTEQEYLAERFARLEVFPFQSQHSLDLHTGMQAALQMRGLRKEGRPLAQLDAIVKNWLCGMGQ